jgi:hypothetical protein
VTLVEYSTDDGATWTPLTLSGEPGHATATVPVPPTAAFVSLRAAAGDEGAVVRRTILRAFAGPAATTGDEELGATTIVKATVNAGRPGVLGPADPYTPNGTWFTAEFTASDPAGVAHADMFLYRGSYERPDATLVSLWPSCTTVKATTARCRADFAADVRSNMARNALAGPWRLAAWAEAADGRSFTDRHAAATVSLLRQAELTTNATPEPVRKGKTITVKGVLTRVDWETGRFAGYSGRKLALQFRRAGTKTYRTVKTVTSDSKGNVKATVKASIDGTWRFVYTGDAATAKVNSAGDYVDVR